MGVDDRMHGECARRRRQRRHASMSRRVLPHALLLGFAVAYGHGPAHAESLKLKKGMSFTEARKQILEARWQPDPASASRETAPIGVENVLLEAGISEVEFCAMDQALCTFKYKKANACLRLTTQGEELEDMAVLKWTYRCQQDD